MKQNEIFDRLKKKIICKIEDFKQGRQSWRLKEWYHLQSSIYLIYCISSFIFVRLLANSNPENNNYDHFVNDPSDINNISHCGITPIFNFIPIPGSYILIIYSVYFLCIISLIISLLSFILGFSFRYFSRIPRSYFFSPSKRTRFLGFCCKILPMIIRILNLLFILFLLIPFIYITTSGACYRRLVKYERIKVQNCRIWVNKCAKDYRILGRHLECSLRKNFKHFPTEIVEDPTIGENLDILVGGPMPLLCPMCNEIRMDPKSILYKGEAYVDQLKSSISKMESINIKDRSIYQTEALSLIQINKNIFNLNKKEYNLNEYSYLLKPILFSDISPFIRNVIRYNYYNKYLIPLSLIQTNLINNNMHVNNGINNTNIKNNDLIKLDNEDFNLNKKKSDLVSLDEPINIDLNSDYMIQNYDTRPINIPNKINIPSKYKSIVEKYALALSSQVSSDSLINEDDIHRKKFERKEQINDEKDNYVKILFKFSGDLDPFPLSFDQTIDLNREFEAARYQIQVATHEGSNFSRSIFIFMLISLIFWGLARFFSYVIFQATQTEACFYLPNTKKTLIWSNLRNFMDILS